MRNVAPLKDATLKWFRSNGFEAIPQDDDFWEAAANTVYRRMKSGEYEEAVEVASTLIEAFDASSYAAPPLLLEALYDSSMIQAAYRDSSDKKLFQLGLEFRARGRDVDWWCAYSHFRGSMAAFVKLEEEHPDSELAHRSAYLRASILRELKKYSVADLEADEFLRKYPSSCFVDDMLAERALKRLLIDRDFGKAETGFLDVLNRFPERNAADNSLSWLVWGSIRFRRYHDAAKYLKYVLSEYPATKHAVSGAITLAKLAPIIAQAETLAGVEGLLISDTLRVCDIDRSSPAWETGFRPGDKVTGVGAATMAQYQDFWAATDTAGPGVSVDFELRRRGASVTVKAQLSEVHRYPEVFNRSLDSCGW